MRSDASKGQRKRTQMIFSNLEQQISLLYLSDVFCNAHTQIMQGGCCPLHFDTPSICVSSRCDISILECPVTAFEMLERGFFRWIDYGSL